MKTQATHDLYSVLCVRSDADMATIRRAYRACVRHAHPDRRPKAEATRAHEEMALINLAYETLSDPLLRAEYDAGRWAATAGQSAAPPPPQRAVVLMPMSVDFGTVYVGQRPPERKVRLQFSDGSRISCARILTEDGFFWYTGPAVFRDVPNVDIRIFGQLGADAPVGQFADLMRVQMDEVTVHVQLAVAIEVAPAAPEPAPATPRPRPLSGVAHGLWLALVLLVAVIAGVAVYVSGQSGHQAAPSRLAPRTATAGAPPSKYCSVASSGGQVLSYYLTKPGVAKQAAAGKDPIWSVMAPTSGDDYVTWWTPAFPYWERANLYDGFFDDAGTRHSKFDYAEVLAYADVPWLPLPEVFQRYPEVNASVEAVQRKLFIQDWSEELGSPPCN
jgi:hypothetical protein